MVTPLYCKKCGTKLPVDSQFCPTCGTSQDRNEQSPTSKPLEESSDLGTGRLPTGRMLHNRYRMLHTIGQGGMGAVYVAQDTQLGDRLVAVKEMSMSRLTSQQVPQAVEQFKREAHLLAGLHHPDLPVIYEYFGEAERWYLVMSFIQGGSLQSYLDVAPGHKLPIKEVVRIGIALCNVLDYLHTHQPQIIFRDLKPLNIMLTPKGQVYLIDFGIARHFKQEQTKDTAYFYSVGYAPPEQYGQSQTGPRSDIYSLGATLYHMLTGHNPATKPFHFPSLRVLDPSIPILLAQLITQMLELDEQQRPESMAVVKAGLEKVVIAEQGEEPKKGVNEKKETSKSEQIDLHQNAAKKSSLSWRQNWNQINHFLSKWRIVTWIVFILLCAILGIWGAQTIKVDMNNYNSYDSSEVYFWFGDIGIGAALIGLALLLAKGRAIVDIVGGIAFIILANILLLYSTHLFFASTLAYNFSCSSCSFPPYSSFLFMWQCASISTVILFLLGVRFFVRSAKATLEFVVGPLMIVAGIALLMVSKPFIQTNFANLPNIVNWIWIMQILLGIIVIVIAIRKARQNIQSAETRAS